MRIKNGFNLLQENAQLKKAFALMNAAMIQQQNRPDKVRNIYLCKIKMINI